MFVETINRVGRIRPVKYFVVFLIISIGFLTSCFHRNSIYENGLQFAIESNELVRLKLTDGKLIEGFIVNEGNNFLVFYNRAYKKVRIKKEDVKSCEFLCAKEYFYSISHWLNLGDQVLISLRNDGEKRGVVRLITKKSLILRINKISEIDLKWHEIAKIQRIRISSKKLKAKSVIEIIAVFCMFYVIIRGITSINFGLE
ncbi:MAG: hypothetical protein DRP89_08435 [Candidatus Neomarinimicrobiota bacterium]|nr:MAG: hypothetical protein DRP89_08435 [Candidatus Neomarinimicrobiota bacterium]